MTMSDAEGLARKLLELSGKATPGPWEIWDGCSWHRIGVRATGMTVIEPTVHWRDNHPDLHARPEDLRYAVEAANSAPAIAQSLLSAGKEIERLRKALEPFARFADKWAAKPPLNIDDEFYSIHIHTGTPWHASLHLSDCRRASDVLRASTPKPSGAGLQTARKANPE